MGSHRISIRQKFLVAPAIGMVLIAILVTAGRYALEEREVFLRQLLEEDLVAAEEVDRAYQQLSTLHVGLQDLLSRDFPPSEKEWVAVAGSLFLDDLEDVRATLARPRVTDGFGPEGRRNHLALLDLTDAYMSVLRTAVTRLTEDRARARQLADRASIQFDRIGTLFSQLLSVMRAKISTDLKGDINRQHDQWRLFAILGLLSVLAMVLAAFVLSRWLSRDVAEMRNMRDTLQVREKKFRDLYNNTPVMMYSIAANGRLVSVSDYWSRHMGYSRDEVLGRDIVDFMTDDSRRQILNTWRPQFRKGLRPRNLSLQFVKRDGTIFDALLSAVAETDETGEIIGSLSVIIDVTDLNRAKERADHEHAHFLDALESVPLGIVLYDADDNFVVCNQTFRRQLAGVVDKLIPGMPFEEVISTAAERGIIDTQGLSLKEFVRQRMAQHRSMNKAVQHQMEDGTWMLISEFRTHDGGTFITRTDITEIKRTDEALNESEERYALAEEGANDATFDWDIRTGRIFVSSRFYKMMRCTEEDVEVTTEWWMPLVHPDYHEKYKTRMTEHLKGNTEFFSCEYQIARKGGQYIWVLHRGLAIQDASGRAYRMAGSIGNITKRRLAEDGLREAQKMEAVGVLAGGIAHEFNNLLVGISGFANLGVADVDDREQTLLCFEQVLKAAGRAENLTRDLLDFSRRQAIKPTLVLVDLNEVIADIADLVRTYLGESVTLLVEPADRPVYACVDPAQIEQVITNLAINGRDAMPDGGVLTVGTEITGLDADERARHPEGKDDVYACIFLSDTGSGIPEPVLNHMFEPFFTTKEAGKGTGLGLSVVYGIVQQAGGFIDVESVLGAGSTFSILLPLAEKVPERAIIVEPA